jgi:predicted ArsR family transcriptional regulator
MKLVESSNCRQVAIQLGCSYNALKKHLQKLQSEDKQAAVVKLADTSISEVDPVSSG